MDAITVERPRWLPVPPEFMRQARLLVERHKAADSVAAEAAVRVKSLGFDWCRSHRKAPRPTDLMAIENIWRSVPEVGSLKREITRDKNGIVIRECRITAGCISTIRGKAMPRVSQGCGWRRSVAS